MGLGTQKSMLLNQLDTTQLVFTILDPHFENTYLVKVPLFFFVSNTIIKNIISLQTCNLPKTLYNVTVKHMLP
jgi:hypothetical protein